VVSNNHPSDPKILSFGVAELVQRDWPVGVELPFFQEVGPKELLNCGGRGV